MVPKERSQRNGPLGRSLGTVFRTVSWNGPLERSLGTVPWNGLSDGPSATVPKERSFGRSQRNGLSGGSLNSCFGRSPGWSLLWRFLWTAPLGRFQGTVARKVPLWTVPQKGRSPKGRFLSTVVALWTASCWAKKVAWMVARADQSGPIISGPLEKCPLETAQDPTFEKRGPWTNWAAGRRNSHQGTKSVEVTRTSRRTPNYAPAQKGPDSANICSEYFRRRSGAALD
ncbi:hypothetical protein M885DRAFT_753 [Pelagophyceae sp. CCMP2097]|nr:hypothetical protein M885DRAFT_753 [Pelagophyceae sp. CCMP2097]